MFLAALLTGSLATQLKNHAKQSAQAAYRTKVLFDTNQILQQEKNQEDIISATSRQLVKLLGRGIVFYPVENGLLGEARTFSPDGNVLDNQKTVLVAYHSLVVILQSILPVILPL